MYKIGDKVETPLGVGVVVDSFINTSDNKMYRVDYEGLSNRNNFYEHQLKPYTSAHDKLIALGWELNCDEEYIKKHNEYIYHKDEIKWTYDNTNYYYWGYDLTIDKNGFMMCDEENIPSNVDLELSRILTQYLEELE